MAGRGGLFEDFAVVTALLTPLPVGAPAVPRPGAIAEAAWAFPLVGAGIGVAAAVAFLLAQLAGLAAWPAALVAVLAGVAVTGALHEDGLADTADGFGGGTTRERKLEIMRDSRHGTFGIVAVVASLGLRAAALAAVGDPFHGFLALVAAHAASRAVLPVAMRALPPARGDGLGATAGRPGAAVTAIAAGVGAAIALAALGPLRGAIAVALAVAAMAAAAALARQQVGGYTGDTLGAFQQVGEILMLLAASAK